MSNALTKPKRSAGPARAKRRNDPEQQELEALMRSIDEKLVRLHAEADAMLSRLGVKRGD